MNASLFKADRVTHLKIIAVGLALPVLVVWTVLLAQV